MAKKAAKPQCKAITSAGVRCSRKAAAGSALCKSHQTSTVRKDVRKARRRISAKVKAGTNKIREVAEAEGLDLDVEQPIRGDEPSLPTMKEWLEQVWRGDVKEERLSPKGELVEIPAPMKDRISAARLQITIETAERNRGAGPDRKPILFVLPNDGRG